MQEKVTLKTNEGSAFCSFWEQMLIDKLGQYNYRTTINECGYKVAKETEKACQIIVPADEVFTANGNYWAGDDWTIWMPKKAFNEYA